MKLALSLLFAVTASASAQLAPDVQAKVDAAVHQTLEKTGVPSASVGIVQGGRIVYTAGFGNARLHPDVPATATMRYPIGSITKQFTAACILLLQQDGKLSLDDPISKFFPELTRANEVTVRNILTHTSGYSDYAPQDYTIPKWTHATTASAVVHEWAGKPLDFDPGTQWQYSNTNFELAGMIVEKVSGDTYWHFLRTRVLEPLGIRGALDLDRDRDKVEPWGYQRNAFAPLRRAILEAPGWYFADGNLALTPADLLTWDLSIINQSLLSPASYTAMETEMKTKAGKGTGYGLAVDVGVRNGHRFVAHTGEVGGFVAANTIFPDDKVAIVVLTNQEASPAASAIVRAVAPLVVAGYAPAGNAAAEAQAKAILVALQQGKIDRALFTEDANFYFDADTLSDYATSLAPLGEVVSVTQTGQALRGGMTQRSFDVKFAGRVATLSTYIMPDGKIEQFLVGPKS